MDHYPYPSNPLYPPVRVPYLRFNYLPGRAGDCPADFSSFPSLNGWDKGEFLSGNLRSGKSPQDAAAFLQAWLFFGLASTVLGLSPQPEKEFVVGDVEGTDELFVSTKKLPEMIERWTEEVMSYDNAKTMEAIGRASSCLDEACLFSQASASDGTLDGFRLDKDYPEVRLSIMMLGDQLQATLRQAELKLGTTRHWLASKTKQFFGANSFVGKAASKMDKAKSITTSILKSGWKNSYSASLEDARFKLGDLEDMFLWLPDDMIETCLMGPWHWGTSAVLRRRMLDAGWCPYEAVRLQDILAPWAVHYSSGMRRPILFNHAKCTDLHCQAHTIDESTYKTQHVEEGCDCKAVAVPVEEVKSILKDSDSFPAIQLHSEPGSNAITSMVVQDYKTVKATWGTQIVALSHVWSHGIGNPNDNALYQCQLLRLMDLIGRHKYLRDQAGRWLWVDTLCIPLEKEYRKLAIGKLSSVYYNCHAVFVLDKELIQLRCRELKPEEILLRVCCSSWMQRMWTMQEGSSSTHTFVLFADGQIDLSACLRGFQLENPLLPMGRGGDALNMISQMALGKFVGLQYGSIFDDNMNDFHVSRVWNGMRWRQASKPGDEPIIIATLLYSELYGGNSASEIKANKETLRGILDAPGEQKWARLFNYQSREKWPQGIPFVNCRTIQEKGLRWAPREIGKYGREILDSTPARATARGLVIKRPGYLMSALRTKLDYSFEFLDVVTSDWYSVRAMDEEDKQGWPDPETSSAAGKSFALVLSKRQAGYAEAYAVMGIVEEEVDGVIHMELACKVVVAKVIQERKQELHRLLASDPQAASGPRMIRTVSYYKEDQMWCVG